MIAMLFTIITNQHGLTRNNPWLGDSISGVSAAVDLYMRALNNTNRAQNIITGTYFMEEKQERHTCFL